jgi:hypothetical protein
VAQICPQEGPQHAGLLFCVTGLYDAKLRAPAAYVLFSVGWRA